MKKIKDLEQQLEALKRTAIKVDDLKTFFWVLIVCIVFFLIGGNLILNSLGVYGEYCKDNSRDTIADDTCKEKFVEEVCRWRGITGSILLIIAIILFCWSFSIFE